jgi:hypothetical protein
MPAPLHFGSRWNHPQDPVLPRSVDTDAEQAEADTEVGCSRFLFWFSSCFPPSSSCWIEREGSGRLRCLRFSSWILSSR